MSRYELPQSSRNHLNTQQSIFSRVITSVPVELATFIKRTLNQRRYDTLGYANTTGHAPQSLRTLQHFQRRLPGWRSWFNLPHIVILIWVVVLLWGERWIFENRIKACQWDSWERWPKDATPHRMLLLADPQLIDPHSYPGRPWPISTFTELHTDNYMKRSHIQMQRQLHPDTVFFIGDLFDGGREWATRNGTTDDPAWAVPQRPESEAKYAKYWKKNYGDSFWLQEYNRFGSIFFEHWNDYGEGTSIEQRGRKIITGLPGNHDFGFGTNVREYARQRFQAYFGETNRVDVIGNHTFVSIDGLSLSARSAGIPQTESISKPVEEFLVDVQSMKRRAVSRQLKYMAGEAGGIKQSHVVRNVDGLVFDNIPTMDPGPGAAEFPTILLTHVPLYRTPGTPCGPMRERWPPASPPPGETMPVIPDERNGIPINGGYQYQNVLGDTDSMDILNRVGDVSHVFSGDDHDYCELIHPQARGGVKEITIKSMSWAMGVRKPGFLLVSLWNPVDASGEPIGTHSSGHGAVTKTGIPLTIETHLCLLPDQLNIFIKYLQLFCITLVVLLIRAVLVPIYGLVPFVSSPSSKDGKLTELSLLPTVSTTRESTSDFFEFEKEPSNSSTSSTSSHSNGSLAPRSNAVRTRSVSPGPSYGYGLPPSQSSFAQSSGPLIDRAGYYPSLAKDAGGYGKRDDDYDAGDEEAETARNRSVPQSKARIARREFLFSVWRVAWPVVAWYLWLVWKG